MKLLQKAARVLAVCCLAAISEPLLASTYDGIDEAPLRRPISPEQPMWLVHIDTWNDADPGKIIDLVPEDIRPWVVMNISLSVSHKEDGVSGSPAVEDYVAPTFTRVEYGYETAKAWVRACAERGMWCVVQPSSGGYSHLQNADLDKFEELYRDYPNFIGWNFCEQFWGFDNQYSCSFDQRMDLFVDLLKLGHKYGGYLFYSFCGPYWAGRINPVAMIRRYPKFKAACEECNKHWVCCEKFTSVHGFFDIESTCMGTWLSGYAAHYGIRYDNCGWEYYKDTYGWEYPTAIGAIPWLTHPMLTGETVWDGPELIWTQDFHEVARTTDADGYQHRNWERFAQIDNVNIDIFRKFVDGTLRIPSREEVTRRTKYVIINNLTTGDDRRDYLTEQTLFDGLYKHSDDGSDWNTQHNFLKSTGRYPAIPTVAALNPNDSLAQTFEYPVKRTAYNNRWSSAVFKVAEFKRVFAEQYTGTVFADHIGPSWAMYNPFVGSRRAYGYVPFQYHQRARQLHLSLAPYSLVQMSEGADTLAFYLTNFRVDDSSMQTDTLWIEGCAVEPQLQWHDRSHHVPSQVVGEWSAADSILKIIVSHNGPLDVTLALPGESHSEPLPVTPLVRPAAPPVYYGTHQVECEVMDFRRIARCWVSGVNGSLRHYTGQGYVEFGSEARTDLRDTVTVPVAGQYTFRLRYSAPVARVQTVSLYVGGVRVVTMNLPKTSADAPWGTYERKVTLQEGDNEIRMGSLTGGGSTLYLDHFEIEPTQATAIEQMSAEDHAPTTGGAVYDLQGRRLSAVGWCGIYIENGKLRVGQ